MDLGNFIIMRQEGSLLAVFVILLVYDIFASETRWMKWFRPLACLLFALHTAFGFVPMAEATAFGGMYVTSPLTVMMKNILNIGTFIVFLQAGFV